jgi:ribosomal protein S18 acetylase RimI-like enzyme
MSMDEVSYKSIHFYDSNLIRQVVDIHYDSLSYESFITSFGKEFLEKLYEVILSNHVGSVIIATDSGNNVIGFILYCKDTSQVFKLVFRKIHLFLKHIFGSLLLRPVKIFKLLQTPVYFMKERSSIKAELLAISVKSDYRSRLVGEKLMKILDEEYQKLGVSEYKVTVLEKMVESNRFYRKFDMKLNKSFNMYGKKWNLYTKKVNS